MDTHLIEQLARNRRWLAATKEECEQMLDQVRKSTKFVELEEDILDLQSKIGELELAIAADAMADYLQTGDKKPAPCVSIKIFHVLKYDPVAALDWCRVNLPAALTLDKRFFETHAKAVAATQPVPGVVVALDPRVQIASDLTKFVTAVSVDDARGFEAEIES